ncbi:UNVERIFIED_CONTAM: hypothetical protein GTU68_043428 [Idotea baltica]|nr:hypothetical protein [Idotea baltica]
MAITPNQITVFACLLCLVFSALLAWSPWTQAALLFLPFLMLVRMMLNALDGMVAKATDTASALGMALNEICDVISDLALFSAFLLVLPTMAPLWWLLIALAMLTEFTSLAVALCTGKRSHSGPFGKSDRAVYLGVLALLLLFIPSNSIWLTGYLMLGIALATMTNFNRFRPLFNSV